MTMVVKSSTSWRKHNPQNTFEVGYYAYCRGEPLDISQPQEWQNGWVHAQTVEEQILTTG